MIYKKNGHCARIYIGSGTCASVVVSGRINADNGNHQLSRYCQQAVDSGFKLTKYACLAWCPLLAPAKVPTYRTVIIDWKGYSIQCPSQCIILTRTTASVSSAHGLNLPLHIPAFAHTVPSKMVYPDNANVEKEKS